VWQRETARLWRYRSEERSVKVPLLIVHSLISKSDILDLLPENSMVRFLVGEGFDVYLLDWEPAGPADAENTLETYVADLIPNAISATEADEITLLGYCYGGVLALLTAASQSIKPTDQLVQPLNLWDQLWSAARTENFLALNGWTRDQIPFPGALLRQTVDLLIRENLLLSGELPLDGATAKLKAIKRPFLNIFCEQDTIVPPASAEPLAGLVGSRDTGDLRLESGHVGLVAGRYADEVARPAIADWIRRHSAKRKTSTPKEKRDRHTAGGAAA
jgi:polyhydroxyalkanoate synthase